MYAVFKVQYRALILNTRVGLSGPLPYCSWLWTFRGSGSFKPVGLSGLEPPTSRLSGVRSNRLSYKPISWIRGGCPAPCTLILLDISVLVEMNGIEPMTPCLQSRCSPSWATPPYSIEHRASLFCCSAHSVSSWKLVYFLLIKKAKFDKPNFQCTYKVCTIGPSKLNNTYKSNFVIPDLGC